ncbi:hypothetical protein [Pseudanabaena yagii]|uniref:DUF4145 domain-containing protein n=1 Tax=Pseudanabaena yagii GIHE-NHR1 TaxID=2722753 RepID=A0ABX1LX26_9CYAN|nr:hypothetical protein [Pseudanabaena yagii]NMF60752.1 hypothetical protein [Pseudanabaena yagii GIHE-NHR1]
MTPPDAERDLLAALEKLRNASFPLELWKSPIFRGASVVQRYCAPNSPYVVIAMGIVSDLATVGASGVLEPGWDSPRSSMVGLLNAVLEDVRDGSLWRGIWDAKNETCADILEQAESLFESKYFAAATVLAGGTLETHLKDLCLRYNINWSGNGSINNYKDALSAEQKKGAISFFSLGDSKQVTAWGDLRNSAAHDPSSISTVNSVAIHSMIVGIRDFINRVP